MRFALQRGPGHNPRRHLIGRTSPARKGGNLRYKANPVCVTANTIKEVGPMIDNGSHDLTLDDGRVVTPNAQQFSRFASFHPAPGDYWVLNEDNGDTRVYAKSVFERQYRPIEDLNTRSA